MAFMDASACFFCGGQGATSASATPRCYLCGDDNGEWVVTYKDLAGPNSHVVQAIAVCLDHAFAMLRHHNLDIAVLSVAPLR